MKLSPQQDKAALAIRDWYENRPKQQVFYLGGYAGTGKTTSARYFAEHIDGHVTYAAFTGKAAHVLRRKGCEGATTIHRLIYQPKGALRDPEVEGLRRKLRGLLSLPDEQQTEDVKLRAERLEKKIAKLEEKEQLAFGLKEETDLRRSALLIVDECSMVGEKIARDLESFGVKILVLGDPAQLAPVRGVGYWTNRKPDFLLTEIHRQASDSPVLWLATQIRQRKTLRPGDYGSSRVVKRGTLGPADGLTVDQILVGRNKTRHATNKRMRELLGHTEPLPVKGDRLVCLRNNHDLQLLNGSLWTVEGSAQADEKTVSLMLQADDEDRTLCCDAWVDMFGSGKSPRSWFESEGAEDFDYGYALTTHKAQGSQWNDVLVVDESSSFGSHAWRWLYTAVTRASDKVLVSV